METIKKSYQKDSIFFVTTESLERLDRIVEKYRNLISKQKDLSSYVSLSVDFEDDSTARDEMFLPIFSKPQNLNKVVKSLYISGNVGAYDRVSFFFNNGIFGSKGTASVTLISNGGNNHVKDMNDELVNWVEEEYNKGYFRFLNEYGTLLLVFATVFLLYFSFDKVVSATSLKSEIETLLANGINQSNMQKALELSLRAHVQDLNPTITYKASSLSGYFWISYALFLIVYFTSRMGFNLDVCGNRHWFRVKYFILTKFSWFVIGSILVPLFLK